MTVNFVFPETGYFYYNDEDAYVSLRIVSEKTVSIFAKVTDYNKNPVNEFSAELNIKEEIINIPVRGKQLGYYRVDITVSDGTNIINKVIGVGITTKYEPVSGRKTKFGLNTSFMGGERAYSHVPAIAKMGITMLRRTYLSEYIPYEELLKKYDMKVLAQWPGSSIPKGVFACAQTDRYAPPEFNTAYQMEKACGDYVAMYEFGNEHYDESNLSLSAEWTKDTGFARLSANPKCWCSTTGLGGIDINKLQEYYEQGTMDYITFIGIHPYSFPNAPENPDGFWSLSRLEDLAKWMNERGINLPVAATEVGYPALYDQTQCEIYSPGDMVDLEGQVDYVIRSWLYFIACGLANVQLFNGPWQEGFGIMEKDGPAPWPVAMALCELIRQVDKSEYIGNLEKEDDPNFYYMVFRKPNGSLFALTWKVVYLSRSCDKSINFAVDRSGATEADKTVCEEFDLKISHTLSDYEVRDIMGNKISVSDGTVKIGERPIYIDGLSEDIIPLLKNKTLFHTKEVVEKPLPSPIILGIQDQNLRLGAYLSSRFVWGETRNYILRVHNYSKAELVDSFVIELPSGLSTKKNIIPFKVAPNKIAEFVIPISCDTVAECGSNKIRLTLQNTKAAPAIQGVEIACPLKILPIFSKLENGSKIDLEIGNCTNERIQYDISVINSSAKLLVDKKTVEIESGKTENISATFAEGSYPVDPKVTVFVSNSNKSVSYDIVIPLHYIELAKCGSNENQSMNYVAGYNLESTFGDENSTGSLLGHAKPKQTKAQARLSLDDEYLYAHFEVEDDMVVCPKLGRRNNIDCDGVWLTLYKSMEDAEPYRHFCVTPLDQAGRTEGAGIKEIAGGVLFSKDYSDFDLSTTTVKSSLCDNGYTLDFSIRRDSIDIAEDIKEIIADIRVINMNNDDWPRLYDTGKIAYKII